MARFSPTVARTHVRSSTEITLALFRFPPEEPAFVAIGSDLISRPFRRDRGISRLSRVAESISSTDRSRSSKGPIAIFDKFNSPVTRENLRLQRKKISRIEIILHFQVSEIEE